MTEPISIRMLKCFARDLGVSFDDPIEEIEKIYERRKREVAELLGPIEAFKIQLSWEKLKDRKQCKECKRFCAYFWMKALPNSYDLIVCGDECLRIYKLRLEADQLRLPAILQITNQWQQNNITHEEVFATTQFQYEDLFQDANRVPCCVYENDPIFHPVEAFRNHIQNCLTTKDQIENFKNAMLRIIQAVVQNRPEGQTIQTNNFSESNFSDASSTESINDDNSSYSSSPESYSSSGSYPSSISSGIDNSSTSDISKETFSSDQTNSSTNSISETEGNSSNQEGKEKPNVDNNTSSTFLGGGSSTITEIKANSSNPSQSNPTSPIPHKKESNPESISISQENQSKDNAQSLKEKVIQEVQSKLKDLPVDLKTLNNGQYQNWEQEIEQLTSLEQITAYQKALLQTIEQNNQPQNLDNKDTKPAKGKYVAPIMVVGGILLIGGLALFKKLKKNK